MRDFLGSMCCKLAESEASTTLSGIAVSMMLLHSKKIHSADSYSSSRCSFAAPCCESTLLILRLPFRVTQILLSAFVFACLGLNVQTAIAQSSLFAEPVISSAPTFGRQVSTQIKSDQETDQVQLGSVESIIGEEIPGTMKAEIIDGPNLFGPLNQDPNAATRETPLGDSALPSLGIDATLRGSGSGEVGDLPAQETPSMDSLFLPDGSYRGNFTSPQSTRRTRETSDRLRGETPVLPKPSTQSVERLPGLTDDSHEVIRQNYPNGKTKIQRTVAQDETGNYYNDGRWIMFNEQGQPITIGTYSRGVMEGMWLRSHPVGSGGIFSEIPFSQFQGPYKSRASFNRGKLDGEWVMSDRQDNPMCEIPYVDGVRHGVAKWFYPNGTVMRQVRFNEGSPDGLLQQWDEQKKLQLQEEFANGRKIIRQRAFYPNKVKSKEDVYQDKKLIVEGEDDWWSARPAPFSTVGERVQHGRTAAWYENNQPKMLGNYQNNLQQGTFTWWHANGNKELEGRFVKGKKAGVWTWWYESGMKKIQGTYVDDEPDGPWLWWNADGEVVDRKTFPVPNELDDIDLDLSDSVLDNANADSSETFNEGSSEDASESAIDNDEFEVFIDSDPFDEGNQDDETTPAPTFDDEPGSIFIDESDGDSSMEPIFGEPEDSAGVLPARIFEDQ
jgi:antitoxin component YwqK of YwqJK toxin-antitoxin module